MFVQMKNKLKNFIIIMLIFTLSLGGLTLYQNLCNFGVVSTSVGDTLQDFYNFENAIINLNKNDAKSQNETNKPFRLVSSDNEEQTVQEQSEFELKRLIVSGKLKETYGAISFYSYNNLHILCYNTTQETEFAYNELIKDKSLNVSIDQYHQPEGYADEIYDYSTGYKNWGPKAIDVGGYGKYLTDKNVTKQVVVVVMDTGLNTSHEMFEGRLLTKNGKVKGFSYYNSKYQYSYNNLAFDSDDANKFSFEDDGSHGTHVAGIICDLTPSNVKILPIKIGNPENNNNSTSSTMMAAYLRVINVYSKQYNVVCTNLSYSGAGKNSEEDRDNFNENCYTPLKEIGILPVTAAGNESSKLDLEGLEAVVVSALKQNNENKNIYEFDYDYSNYGKIIDISAPGTNINSAVINSTDGAASKIYGYKSGTSMASPQVAGVVALLYLNPKLQQGFTANDIEQTLYDLSVDLGVPGKDTLYGHGMVNIRYFDTKETATLHFYRNSMIIEEFYDYELFTDPFSLKMVCSNSTFNIIYTTDGTIPNIKSCINYQQPLNITDTIFIYAMGVKIENGEITQRTELYSISFFYELTPIEDCFEINSMGTITKYTGKYKQIDIPRFIKGIEVKTLGNSLFKRGNIESVSLPESCKTIAGYAFQYCYNLKYLYGPGVTLLQVAAFNLSGIPFVTDQQPEPGATDGVYLPQLTEVGAYTFLTCESLESVKLSKMDLKNAGGCFANCINLKSAELPSLTAVPDDTFNNCPKLESFIIGKNVKSIGEQAFAKNQLKTISVESGNNYLYSDNNKAVYTSNALCVYATGNNGDYSILDKVTINGSTTIITTLKSMVLYECSLNSLTIPNTITTVDKNFAAQSEIKNVYFNAKKITNTLYSFEINGEKYIAAPFGSTKIENIVIGESVQEVPYRFFQESLPKNITIKSISTNFASCSLYIFRRDNNPAPYNIYLDFTDTVTTSFLDVLHESQAHYQLHTLYSKTKLPSTYSTYLSNVKYKGVDNSLFVYSKTGAMVKASVTGSGTITPSGDVAVLENQSKTFTITPNTGHLLVDVVVNGVSVGRVNSYTFDAPTKDQTIVAKFAPVGSYFTIDVIAGEGGTISPNEQVLVEKNKSKTFTITPNSGYKISDVKVNGISQGSRSSYTFTNVTSNHTIEASFEKVTYKISTTVSGNGQISPSGIVDVEHGANKTFTFIPDEEHYVSKIIVDETPLGQLEQERAIQNGYTFRNITAAHTIKVEFAVKKYVVTYILADYDLENIVQEYTKGETIVIPSTPFYTAEYYFDGWYTDSSYTTKYEFSTMGTQGITVYGKFNAKSYIVNITTGNNGTVLQNQLNITVLDNSIINILPNNGYKVGDIIVDNISVDSKMVEYANSTNTFNFQINEYGYKDNSIQEQHTVHIVFAPIIYNLIFNLNYDDETIMYNLGTDATIQTPNAPQRVGYEFVGWYNEQECRTKFNLTVMPASNLEVFAKWQIKTYKITTTVGQNGSISPSGIVEKDYNTSQIFTIFANTGYHIAKIIVDDVELEYREVRDVIENGYLFKNLSQDHTITVEFEINTYIIELNVQGKGRFYCEQELTEVKHGESRTFKVEMSNLYNVEILVNNVTQYLTDGKLIIDNIDGDLNIEVVFTEKGFFETPIGLIAVAVAVISVITLIIVVSVFKAKAKRKLELGHIDFKNLKFK